MTATLQVSMALTRLIDGDYRFVARWRFDGAQNRLPRSQDKFVLALQRASTGEWLDATGAWSAAPASFEVTPVQSFMIQPPRAVRAAQLYPAPGFTINAATAPIYDVDCSAHASGDLPAGTGLGVCNVLDEVQDSRIAWRVASQLRPRFLEALTTVRAADDDKEILADELAEDFAHDLGVNLVGLRATRNNLPQLIEQALEIIRRGGSRAAAHLFTFRGGARRRRGVQQYQDMFRLLSARILRDAQTRTQVLRLVQDLQQLREQWLLKGHLGGRVIDFGLRAQARTLPITEAAGLGWSSRTFTPGDVQQWSNQGERFTLTVTHVPAPLPATAGAIHGATRAADLDGLGFDANDPGSASLTDAQVRRAAVGGSSHPLNGPSSVEIDYAMHEHAVRTDPPLPGRSCGFVTGDGNVGFIIRRPRSGALGGLGYNVYGAPDDGSAPSAAVFAQDPGQTPLALLRPFRMTRRYSLEEDFLGPFPGGVPNAAVMDDPPWEPLMPTPDAYTDGAPQIGSDGKLVNELPAVRIADADLWSYNLRKGMRAAGQPALPLGALWDPIAPAEPAWRPDLNRAGQPAPTGQRYRFFVTTVDVFGQESAATPAWAHDVEAGETATHDFVPRRRTSPGAVKLRIPAGAATPADALDISADGASLSVAFDPVFDQSLTPIDPAVALNYVRGLVRVYRRPLREPVLRAPLRGLADPAAESEAWFDEDRRLTKLGWVLWKDAVLDPTPYFKATWPLGYADKGFEYLAVTGLYITASAALLWQGPVASRTLRLLASGGAMSDNTHIWESPNYGGLAVTDPVALVNPAPPRAVRDATLNWRKALPVRPQSDIDRDLVLMRLIERRTVDEQGLPIDFPDWGHAGQTLSEGQAVMLEKALRRAWPSNEDPVALKELQLARELLVGDIKHPSARLDGSSSPLPLARRTSVIGFRGLVGLSWSYDSVWSYGHPGQLGESEAVRLRAYWRRASIDQDACIAESTLLFVVDAVGPNGDWVEGPAPAKADQFVQANGVMPILAAAWGATATSVASWCDVTTLQLTARGTRLRLGLRTLRGPAPGAGWQVALHVAALAGEQVVAETQETTSDVLWLPVGGGQPEFGVWWLAAVSAQGAESTRAARSVLFSPLPGTVEPASPVMTVRPPTNGAEILAPSGFDAFNRPMSDWLPTDLEGDEYKRTARLVVRWRPYAPEGPTPADGVRILVERDRRLVIAGSALARASMIENPVREALEAIQALGPSDDVRGAWVEALVDWLAGQSVVDRRGATDDELTLHGYDRPISGEVGLQVADGAPALIDYLRDPIDGAVRLAMDGSYFYAYRLTAYRDLFGDPNVDPSERYLLSRPTAWSGFVAPGVLPFQIQEVSRRMDPSSAANPTAEFRFNLKPLLRMTDDPHGPWRVRVMVERKVLAADKLHTGAGALPSDTDTWTLVDRPAILSSASPDRTVVDTELTRALYDEAIAPVYRITIVQYLTPQLGQSGEALLQSPTDLTVVCPFGPLAERNPQEYRFTGEYLLAPV